MKQITFVRICGTTTYAIVELPEGSSITGPFPVVDLSDRRIESVLRLYDHFPPVPALIEDLKTFISMTPLERLAFELRNSGK